MAEKRAFATEVLESDAFTNLSVEAKLLYMYINIKADDDGICSKVKMAAVLSDTSNQQLILDELIASGFLISVEGSNRVIITHWRVHNKIRGDMYKPTLYPEDFKGIYIQRGKRGADIYTLRNTGIPAKMVACDTDAGNPHNRDANNPESASTDNYNQYIVEFQKRWNEIDGVKHIKDIDLISSQRKKMYTSMLQKYGDSAETDFLEHIRSSSFLRGKTGRKGDYETFVVTLDWALKPENVEKIMSGTYDDYDEPKHNHHADDEISNLY